MKVFHVINGLGTGGAQRSMAELFPFLLGAGIEPVVICSQRHREGVHDHVQRLGVEVRVLPVASFPARVHALRRLIRSERPDIVHSTIFESDVLARIAAVRTGVPVLTSLVNTSYSRIRLTDPLLNRRKLRIAQSIDGFTARHLTSWFHAVSAAVRDGAVSALGIDETRITVVERGRDVARLGEPSIHRRRTVRAQLGIDADAEVLLNVGRQEHQKGHRTLLAAADLVLRERPNAICLVVGRAGNATSDLQGIHSRLATRDRIRFLGHRDDIGDLLCASDVFVFPSLYEGFSGSILEAMAMAVPVVGSRIPTIQEAVKEGVNGLLVEPESSAALASVLVRLLDQPCQRSRLGHNGRELFLERFTVDRIAPRMVDLFRQVAALRPRGEPMSAISS